MRLRGNGSVLLYLQEPLCAASVFVDGICLGVTGDVSPDSYSPLIKDNTYAFTIDGEAELIIQTANYSHYYGGIWYAPVIGDAESVSRLIAARMLLYGMLFFHRSRSPCSASYSGSAGKTAKERPHSISVC